MDDPSISLAAMASHDLDAALQLLAERAQYLTGADGAVIALRREDHNDMLCRASSGSRGPELGALLSMESGFSGECVRLRQALRCDNAEQDARVNRENCRRLGISSVVAIPILSDQHVLGIFELFSARPNAFTADTVSALHRLSAMVETAVKYAITAQAIPAVQLPPAIEKSVADANETKLDVETDVETLDILENPDALSTAAGNASPLKDQSTSEPDVLLTENEKGEPPATPEPAPKKPRFWSATTHASENRIPAPDAATSVPPVLRNLHKCKACGFPVSEGRVFCVECEDKQWRGQP
jgi:hypothetical protein